MRIDSAAARTTAPVTKDLQQQPAAARKDPFRPLFDKLDAHVRQMPVAPVTDVNKMTPLQKHVAFFDRNHDGKITVGETYAGCRALGLQRVPSAIVAILINGGMGWGTSGSPLPTLDVSVGNIQRGMHGSDSEVYDADGKFDARKFDAFFDRWDKDGDGHWSWSEFWARANAQRDLWDIFGRVASIAEFGLVFVIAGEDGKISRGTLRKVYDGSLFYELEQRRT